MRGKPEAEDIEGILSVFQLLIVIDGVNFRLSLRDIDVVVDVVAGAALGAKATLANPISCK